MSGQDWIALLIAGAGLLFAVRWVRKSLSAEAGCGCGSGKPCHVASKNSDDIPKATMKPLVQLHTPSQDQSSNQSDA